MGIIHKFPRQLRKPEGILGRLIGKVMKRGNRQPNEWVISLLEIEPEDKILEIGFGPGFAIKKAAEKAKFVAGIDFSEVMVKKAGKLNKDAIKSGKVELILGEASNMPYKENSFDKVFSVNVIYFWESPLAVLKKIKEIMKPKGRLVIYATSKGTLDKLKLTRTDVFRGYDSDELVQLLRKAGFKKVKCEIRESRIREGVCVIGEK